MTQLRNIDRYNLARLLAHLINSPNDAKVIWDETFDETNPTDIKKFDYCDVKTDDTTPMEMWSNIITAAEEQQLLLVLLSVVIKEYNGDIKLNSFYGEIKEGFGIRVAKIAAAIKKNECVLFIGPELLQCRNGANLEAFSRYFSMQLSKTLDNKGVYFEESSKDSLSYIADRYEAIPNTTNRDLGKLAVKSFNDANLYKEVYRKITTLNFPLIISTNPDNILEKEYDRLGISYSSGYYDRSNQDKNEAVYDENKTILYKIFGSFESPYSILFTDKDRVQFSKNVVRNDPKVPPIIKVLLENKYCLFLGFNFEEWHLNILIDCLGLSRVEKEERIFALLMDKAKEPNIEHFEKNYKFYFINDQIEEFMDDVIEAIKKIP
ncbi:MAG: SIR2 family protein [Ferruginibacter sp.]